MAMYDIYQVIKFSIRSSNDDPVIPKKANPLLISLRRKLDKFFFKEGGFLASIIDIDEFKLRQTTPNKVDGSYQIRWNVTDLTHDRSEEAFRFNNLLKPILADHLKKMGEGEEGRQDLRLEIYEVLSTG